MTNDAGAFAEELVAENEELSDEAIASDDVVKDSPPDAPPEARHVGSDSRNHRSGGGFVGLLFGGLVAAAIGYGTATYFPIQSKPDSPTELAELRATVDSQANSIRNFEGSAKKIEDLEQRLAAVEDVEPVSTTTVDLGPIESALASLETRLAAIESLPAGEVGQSTATVAAALDSMKAEIEALKGQGESAAATIAAAAAEAEARLAEAEAQAVALKAEAEATAKKALHIAALGRISASLEAGGPYEGALGDLDGLSIPETLTTMASTGVPTLQALMDAFPESARTALEVSRRATMGEGLTDRISSFLETATGARSLSPREGSDPDAILSRAEAAVGAGNLETALTEIGALPPEGQEAMSQWTSMAQSRLDVLAAFETLSASISE
ncbi:COG4223 family protein [Thioclava sp. FR2]|uniref:COG4223 family protein n=1 Tax=Thioclava sp. FR2 TaxID=3445780 RepID=UPI003EC119C4